MIDYQCDQPRHILIVDHDQVGRNDLSHYLSRYGFHITLLEKGAHLLRFLSARPIDLIILEPQSFEHGDLTLLVSLRHMSDVACIVVTSNCERLYRIDALEIGADDYLTKPVDKRELLARIRAVIRRGKSSLSFNTREEILNGAPALELVAAGRRIRSGMKDLSLTTAEFKLMSLFAESPFVPLAREQLSNLVFGRVWHPDDRAIDVLVLKLRRKIEENPNSPRIFQSVRGFGYVFTGRVTAA